MKKIKRIKRRPHISFLALKTKKLLFIFVFSLVVLVGTIQLFLSNYLMRQGYTLTVETIQNKTNLETLETLESNIAKYETRKFIIDNKTVKQMPFVNNKKFIICNNLLTAK